jgi:NitT/TauT family transport system substrate-binding protein
MSMMRWFLLGRLILVAALLSNPAIVSGEPLRVVYTAISLMYGPLWVTQEAGIFKKNNLDVELLYISGGTLSTAALVSGDAQIAFTGAANVVAANVTGSDVILLGATIDRLPFEVWTVPSIKASAQLKGTKMGVTRIGSTTHFVARYVLKSWGLRPDGDVIFFQTGGQPELFAALKGGFIQSAILNAGPFTVRAQKEGFVRLADVAAMGRPYVYGTVAARESFVQSRSELMSRFARAFVEGIYRFKTDKRLALATIEKYTKTKTTAESEQVYEIYANRYIKRTPEITREGMQTVLEEIAESRPMPTAITAQRFLNSRYFKELSDNGFVDELYRVR